MGTRFTEVRGACLITQCTLHGSIKPGFRKVLMQLTGHFSGESEVLCCPRLKWRVSAEKNFNVPLSLYQFLILYIIFQNVHVR